MKKSNLILMFISLLAAVFLWVYVVTIVNPDGDTTISGIPVTFSGAEVLREDHDLVVTGDYQEFVTVRFYGKNSDMKKLELGRDEIRAVVDVSKVRSTKEYTLSYTLTLPNSVQQSAITNLILSPSSITFRVERYITRDIEVTGDFTNVLLSEGFLLDSTSYDYDSVTVEGPESIVSTIQTARVTPNRINVDKTITESLPYELLDEDGNPVDTSLLSVSVTDIEVTMNVIMYKEVPVIPQFKEGGGVLESDCTVDFEPQVVTLSGSEELLSTIDSILLDPIDLSLLATNSETVSVPITIPEGVRNDSGEEDATVHIEIPNKQIKTFKTGNIIFINVAEGLTASSISQQLSVTVRAAASQISRITSSSIVVVADMSGYMEPGTYQLPVTIRIDSFSGAGAVGEYSITVSLARTPDEPGENGD